MPQKESDAFKRAATRWVRLDWKQIVQLRERQKTQKIGKEITEARYYKREIGETVADNAASDDDDGVLITRFWWFLLKGRCPQRALVRFIGCLLRLIMIEQHHINQCFRRLGAKNFTLETHIFTPSSYSIPRVTP